MTLTVQEYNVLNKIATKSKMDCWFWLKQDKNGNDYVYDIEEGKRMSLKKGVWQLADGFFFDYTEKERNTLLDLDEEEIQVFRELLVKLKINENEFLHLKESAQC